MLFKRSEIILISSMIFLIMMDGSAGVKKEVMDNKNCYLVLKMSVLCVIACCGNTNPILSTLLFVIFMMTLGKMKMLFNIE